MAPPRVRFAPAPTGDLNAGDARVALLNWLFARRSGGTFILRIEDDERQPRAAADMGAMLDALRWLGLTWDEGPDIGGPCEPYVQSARVERHRAAARRLLIEGHAYYCYCSPEHLRDERERAEARGDVWQYGRTCLALSAAQARDRETAGAARALRFKVPGGRTGFDDGVHGRIEFDGAHMEDFVVLHADGRPSSDLAVVVADAEMGITHVIHGDHHLPDTPRQVLLFQALGASVPHFVHVPPIAGPERDGISGLPGAASIQVLRRQGYLADALVHVLALPGAPGRDVVLLPMGELIERFSIEDIGRSPAVFDAAQLDRLNREFLARLEPAALASAVRPLMAEAGLGSSPLVADEASFHRLLQLLRPRVTRLTRLVEEARAVVEEVVVWQPGVLERYFRAPGLEQHLRVLAASLRATAPFDESHVEAAVRGVAAAQGVEWGLLIDALGVAVTGSADSPPPLAVITLIGRERTVARLDRLLLFLSSHS